MKSGKVALSMALLVCSGAAWAQSYSTLPLFDTSIFAKRYLWYCWLRNAFDTCNVDYQFGEVRVGKGDSLQPVLLSLRKDEVNIGSTISPWFYGLDNPGIDTLLRKRCRTQPFYVPDSSTIEFFRLLSVSLGCGKRREGVKDTLIIPPQPVNMIAAQWKLYEGCVLDTTEFVLELVRASDEAIIAVLDSVGVVPNPTSQLIQHYGTNPTMRTLRVPIPQQAWGTIAYVRVSPRRYGPTPLGLQMCKVSAGIRLSVKYPDADTAAYYPRWMARFVDRDGRDPLDSLSFTAAIAAIDHQAQQYGGCVIYIPGCVGGKSGQDIRQLYDSLHAYIAQQGYVEVFDSRYQHDTIGHRCQRCWWETVEWYRSTLDDTVETETPMAIRTIANLTSMTTKPLLTMVNPVSEYQPLTIIASRMIGPATVQIYDATGRAVVNTDVHISAGANTLPHNLCSGIYRVVVRAPSARLYQQFGLVIVR